jgi:hypothetical protein
VGDRSFTVERHVGRLVEVRVHGPLSSEDIKEFPRLFTSVVDKGPVIACGDLRGLNVLAPELSEEFTENLRRDNPKVLRSALLVSKSAAAVKLQMSRLTREVGGPVRRVFEDRPVLELWLTEVLTKEESHRLSIFLSDAR